MWVGGGGGGEIMSTKQGEFGRLKMFYFILAYPHSNGKKKKIAGLIKTFDNLR